MNTKPNIYRITVDIPYSADLNAVVDTIMNGLGGVDFDFDPNVYATALHDPDWKD